MSRIPFSIEVPRVAYDKLNDDRLGGSSAIIRGRVELAREIQHRRFAGTRLVCNAELSPAEVRQHCKVDGTAQSLLKAAMAQLHLSSRAFHRILKLARTVADLDAVQMIEARHVAESIQYRPRGIVSTVAIAFDHILVNCADEPEEGFRSSCQTFWKS